MADESFNLDSLLEDLDEAVRTSPKDEGLSPHTVKFVPHPPPFDRPHHPSTPLSSCLTRCNICTSDTHALCTRTHSQVSFHNPKTKFARQSSNSPTDLATSPEQTHSGQRGSHDTDENSLDNLLHLLNSPRDRAGAGAAQGSHYSSASVSKTSPAALPQPYQPSSAQSLSFSPSKEYLQDSQRLFQQLGMGHSFGGAGTGG
eukprot:CAMPEP_0173234446 /NCGR_PEP_ID=MMETSP1142-20121109/10223_1 /TAXON_ID=483371 /ORGANISM="non described non described, Strain CCMP2298" /LENGTH=200 /DNA_ID=CAMNT_0014164473 /DNA_START=58 /DNA_END=657 /DNA_ORIENTATION=+